uniref:Protein-L-isoaspartate O-methyltransferase n=1 Tax=Candidatus Giovannonibacteria bacterium GW2011_GWF2_42_19 TaxID=1618659 RepID=A0A0G1BJ13_9BACT|nr:MAG: Protein-L-isoaspartate(D-aspartate)O-methyltrans ferase [Candidatus Giovannonibacteria bacterium GW2011_GWF2_42_19]
MEELVKKLEEEGVLKSPLIKEAFLKVDRKNFLPEELKDRAYEDSALPIGEGQTISQPFTVAFMLELLEPRRGDKIMDVGSGSGWTSALLSHIVNVESPTFDIATVGGSEGGGKIFAFEIKNELCEFGEKNVESSYPELALRISFICGDAKDGLPGEAPFDGILSSAEVLEVPKAWRHQLVVGGNLIYPKGGSLFKEIKLGENKFELKEYPGFVFVPFI